MIFGKRRTPVYNPEDDEDLFYWFDASDTSTLKGAGGTPITDGMRIAEWLNKGSAATIAAQSNASIQPIWSLSGLGGRPAIDFSTHTSARLQMSSRVGFASIGEMTVMVAACYNDTSSSHVFGINDSQDGPLLQITTNASGYLSYRGRRTPTQATTTRTLGKVTANVPFIATTSIKYNAAQVTSHRDGVLNEVAGFSTAGLTGSGTPVGIMFGSNAGLIRNRYVFELFLWRRALSPQELVGPHHYLRTKWRIEPTSSGGMSLTPGFGGEEEESMLYSDGEFSPMLNCENCEEPLNEVGMCDSCYSNEEM